MKLHAVCNGNMDYAADNLKTLFAGQDRDFMLLINRSDVCLFPAIEAYKRGTEAAAFVSLATKSAMERPDMAAFYIRVHSRDEDGARGDVIELNGKALHENISRYAAVPDRIDAVFSNGALKSYDLYSWAELPSHARNVIQNYEPHFPESGLNEATRHYTRFIGANEMFSVAVEMDVFIPEVNAAYMNAARHPQPDMIRVGNEAAKEILARGKYSVFNLTPEGAVKLAVIEAMRPMCFAEHRDLAIKREEIAGLDKWAERAVKSIQRQHGREERNKINNKGEEL
jgi:hypothetical protein